jgi:hypothetical protein
MRFLKHQHLTSKIDLSPWSMLSFFFIFRSHLRDNKSLSIRKLFLWSRCLLHREYCLNYKEQPLTEIINERRSSFKMSVIIVFDFNQNCSVSKQISKNPNYEIFRRSELFWYLQTGRKANSEFLICQPLNLVTIPTEISRPHMGMLWLLSKGLLQE